MGWALIPKLAFAGLLIAAVVSRQASRTGVAVFLALGAAVWFGLPYLPRGADLVTPALAIIDVVLVLIVFKGDVRFS
jgi:hypothetical protein